MSSVNFFCERGVRPDGTIWLKKKVYHDPKGKLMEYVGRTLKIENPHHPKYKDQGKLYVYDLSDFLITSVVVLSETRPKGEHAVG